MVYSYSHKITLDHNDIYSLCSTRKPSLSSLSKMGQIYGIYLQQTISKLVHITIIKVYSHWRMLPMNLPTRPSACDSQTCFSAHKIKTMSWLVTQFMFVYSSFYAGFMLFEMYMYPYATWFRTTTLCTCAVCTRDEWCLQCVYKTFLNVTNV